MSNVITGFTEEKCCGCLSCVNVCPHDALHKSVNEYRFVIPAIELSKCIDCGLCEKVCPYKNNQVEYHKPIEVYAAISKDKNILLRSSSGGIFSVVAAEILKNNGLVFGATMDSNYYVYHKAISTIESLDELRKSKYIQSDLKNTFQEARDALSNGRHVLFAGTPCQVMALYAFLGKDPKELTTIDIVCHGVPSNDIFLDYIRNLEIKEGHIKKYEFRKKIKLNNGMNCYFSFANERKEKVRNWPEDSFNYLYMKGMIYRDSCYNCDFAKIERASDLTLCDYWNWEIRHKNDFGKYSTVSGIIVNSEKGKKIINSIKSNLHIIDSDYNILSENNACLVKGTEKPYGRDRFLDMWIRYGYETIDKDFKKKHLFERLKYRILMYLPEAVKHIRRG